MIDFTTLGLIVTLPTFLAVVSSMNPRDKQ